MRSPALGLPGISPGMNDLSNIYYWTRLVMCLLYSYCFVGLRLVLPYARTWDVREEAAIGIHLTPERRHRPRARLSYPVRLRPSLPVDDDFDEVIATENMCRDGFYALTDTPLYKRRMRLFVTIPYSDAPGTIDRDYLAEVVRLNVLPDGRNGIAVRLLATVSLHAPTL